MNAAEWLAEGCARLAIRRLDRRFSDWGAALAAEQDAISCPWRKVLWAFGAVRASLQVEPPDLLYPVSLLLGVSAMGLYQWGADESFITLLLLVALSATLGFVRPARYFASGLTIGLVVAGVTGFEALSGVRPAYETHVYNLVHCLRWLALAGPAILGSALDDV